MRPISGRTAIIAALLAYLFLPGTPLRADGDPEDPGSSYEMPPLEAENLLLLVNAESPCSTAVAAIYRSYYPDLPADQVLYLTGLPDCASLSSDPADEIITRDQFETLIAQPVRDYLIASGLVNDVYCIVTTAGMPYRIEDSHSDLGAVVYPAGSSPILTFDNRYRVDAASVESELAVLFQVDPALPDGTRMPIEGRIVNPYQGYISPIRAWQSQRDILFRRDLLRWTYMWRVTYSPKIEGVFDYGGRSAEDRIMSAGDVYLVARLDGPRAEGTWPVRTVREMLRRAAVVSRPERPDFVGYNPAKSVLVVDESDCGHLLAYAQVFNFPPQYHSLTFHEKPTPPGAEEFGVSFNEWNHFERAYAWLTGNDPLWDQPCLSPSEFGLGGSVLWDPSCGLPNEDDLPEGTGICGLMTYGRNAQDGRPSNYLLASGPDGEELFPCVYGAVFSSLESYNAVTMFSDAPTGQGKIVEFITMGGTAAVGHAFEPVPDALVQGDYLMANLLRDDDGDGIGDLTLVEATFTGLPYLSWSEVMIGDPLMRLHLGRGGIVEVDLGQIVP